MCRSREGSRLHMIGSRHHLLAALDGYRQSLFTSIVNSVSSHDLTLEPAAVCPAPSSVVCCCLAILFLSLAAAVAWRHDLTAKVAGDSLCSDVATDAGAEPIKQCESSGGRNALVDNAKALLMVLVIWQHVPNFADSMYHVNVPGGGLARGVWFHMPAFAVLSGMVWRPFSSSSFRRFLAFIVAPIVIWTLIIPPVMSLGMHATGRENEWEAWDATRHPVSAGLLGAGPGELWYLRSLVLWRLAAQALQPLPSKVQLVLSLAAGAAVAVLCPLDFSRDQWLGPFASVRAAQMFPYFALGQHLPWDLLWGRVAAPTAWTGAAAWAAVLGVAVSCNMGSGAVASAIAQIETFPDPYMSVRSIVSGGCQLDVSLAASRYVVGLVFRFVEVLAFLVFAVPRDRTWFTVPGRYSIYPYLLHAPLVYLLVRMTVSSNGQLLLPDQPVLIIALWFVAAAGITVLLTTPPVRFLLGWMVEPQWLEVCLIKLGWK